MEIDFVSYTFFALFAIVFLAAAIKILREYERGVVFTLGRFTSVRGPGLIILIPFVQQMVRVDLRTIVLQCADPGCHFQGQRFSAG